MEALVMCEQFWRGKRVLLTGHTGFKGGWIATWLKLWGAEILGYALPPQGPVNLFDLANVGDGLHSIIADIRDYDRLSHAVASFKPDIAIHMAAQPLVRYSYEAPIETYSTNVMGTVHLFEALRAEGSTRVVLNITSDKCYENREWVWGYRENEPMGGHDPYSSSKGCSELVTSAYQRSYFQEPGHTRLASCRAGNVVGGGDWASDRLVPDIIRSFQRGETVEIRNPNSVRPWQHVLEPIGGYLLLAERLWLAGRQFVGGWNFGPSPAAARPVRDIVDIIAEIWGEPTQWRDCSDPKSPHEARFLFLDIAKARIQLGWEPKLSLRETLEMTVDWYQAVARGDDARAVTEQQILDYLNLTSKSANR